MVRNFDSLTLPARQPDTAAGPAFCGFSWLNKEECPDHEFHVCIRKPGHSWLWYLHKCRCRVKHGN